VDNAVLHLPVLLARTKTVKNASAKSATVSIATGLRLAPHARDAQTHSTSRMASVWPKANVKHQPEKTKKVVNANNLPQESYRENFKF